MRSEQEMIDLLLDFARPEENIRVVLMNGSRVNSNVKRDVLQDFDIVYLVKEVDPYKRNAKVVSCFGDIMILQTPEDMKDPPPEGDGHYAYLMQFMDGNRIDLSFYSIDRLQDVLDDSLTVVLLDKDNIVKRLPPPSDRDYLPTEPTEKLFQDCCNEFWWVSPYVAKGIWREELTYAKYTLDVVIREQLMKMLTWYFGIKTDFKKSPGKLGKYIKNDIEPDIWMALEKTYSDSNFDNIWESLFTMGRLFRRMANEVASAYGFNYPQDDDKRVTEYLWRIKNLPRDATDIAP
jgi:aminoglycoside 6-adenylyltransferase